MIARSITINLLIGLDNRFVFKPSSLSVWLIHSCNVTLPFTPRNQRHCRMISTPPPPPPPPPPYSGVLEFDFYPGCRLSWMRSFVVFLSTSRKLWERTCNMTRPLPSLSSFTVVIHPINKYMLKSSKGYFHWGFTVEILYAVPLSLHATYPSYLIILDLVAVAKLAKECTAWNSSMYNFVPSAITSNTLLSTLFSNTLKICSSLLIPV
jgi:hypothetical protein